MGAKTGIEWTDSTWNPLLGCQRVSPGCVNCYAESLSGGRLSNQVGYRDVVAGGRWNGESAFAGPDRLLDPVRWSRGRRIFVCSMSDLFFAQHKVEHVAEVFAVMAASPHQTFQVLTKRADRMHGMLADPAVSGSGLRALALEAARRLHEGTPMKAHAAAFDRAIARIELHWPLRNVWVGVSAESQEWLDKRLPHLMDTPAAVRFLSCEPLVGPITLPPEALLEGGVDWVIAGGESGNGSRPMHPAWARELRDQCTAAGVAFHLKQWGEWSPARSAIERDPEMHGGFAFDSASGGRTSSSVLPAPGKVGHRYALLDGGQVMEKIGKKDSDGNVRRTLDGRTWSEWPEEPAADTPPATMFDQVRA